MTDKKLSHCPLCNSSTYSFSTTRFDDKQIVRCDDCGHHYLNPTLTEATLEEIYATYHHNPDDKKLFNMLKGWFDEEDSPYQAGLKKLEAMNLNAQKVLDVGCGPGFFLDACRKKGAEVLGVDISPESKRLAKKFFGIEVLLADIDKAIASGALKENSFNVVTAFEIIEHVYEPIKLLKSMKRLLVPGGLSIISTPNYYLFYEMGQAAPVIQKFPEHLQYFDPDSLSYSLKSAGFSVKEVTTSDKMDYGDRVKQQLSQKRTLSGVWGLLRLIPGIIPLKNVVFSQLSKKKSTADQKKVSGLNLLAFATK